MDNKVEIRFLKGDATRPLGEGSKIIVHVCNDIGGWGLGFVLALSERWPEPEAEYRKWYETMENFELGEVQFVKVEANISVANMIAQHNVVSIKGIPPIRYEALDKCLQKVGDRAKDTKATIHMPRIGCGLAGGTWVEVEKLIYENLIGRGIEVFVYDLK